MGTLALEAVVEKLAAAVVLADPEDVASLREMAAFVRRLATSLPVGPAKESARACKVALTDAIAGRGDAASALAAASELACTVQQASAPRPREVATWDDEQLMQDFLTSVRDGLQQIESDALALEKGGASRLTSLKRRLHTMKGEAGAMGFADLERVCHGLEDYLASEPGPARAAECSLRVVTFIGDVATARSNGRAAPSADEVMALLAARPLPAAPPQSAPVPPASEPTPARVDRNEETLALLTEFLHESEEGIGSADGILMNAERDEAAVDVVRGLFGVFHTIKGVAGFLELTEITSVAHATESLLSRCRDGEMSLGPGVLDLVFDATAMMRRLLGKVQSALESSTEVAETPEAAVLIERLRIATEAGWAPEAEVFDAVPGARLGEILVRAPLNVSPEIVDAALKSQHDTGRRLGGEAVAHGVEPKQVAQALRAQARANPTEERAIKLRETVKVDVERIDQLIEMIGELVIAESMVVNAPELAHLGSPRFRNNLGQLGKVTRDLQDVGLRMRMVSVQNTFQKMARMVRDLGQKSGKSVTLEISGEATEMDRSMVEQIADPLVHIIRNAVDHGIDSPAERAAAHKPKTGTIRLAAYHEGGTVVIEISDDGRGLDRDAILAKARAQRLIPENVVPPDSEIHALIFAPGFSTAKVVTELSGRGVGMDVVKRNVEAMRGRILVSTERGRGTTLKICLPLTLAIIDGMLIACGSERYIIPTLSIVESVKPTPAMLMTLGHKAEMMNLRGKILPLERLDRLFGVPDAKTEATDQLVVVVESSDRKIGILVDEVISQEHVVIKSLGAGLGDTPFASGAAIMSDGRVGLILNVDALCSRHPNAPVGARAAEVRLAS